ncbi:MAG: PLP-dependent aminotransferase family protein [Acidobacteriota bacterium]|jgi:DNA-binding transcriptional MocR family regulator
MATWQPDLSDRTAPRYLAIADALARDISRGSLPPGTRLPTHRDLARRLGVTVGTVSRGYAEAERRGLVRGEVGRGTFVRGEEGGPDLVRADGERSVSDLTQSIPPSVRGPEETRILERGLQALARRAHLPRALATPAPAGALHHREIAARFLSRIGMEVPAERVLITCGAQHGMAAVLASLTRPNDVVLAESVTFPGMKGLARLLSLRLHGVPVDSDGIVPEELARAARATGARVLYTIPTLQNPTSSVLPERRRARVAAIAAELGIAVLEDEVYGFLPDQRPAPIAARVPDLGYLLTSVSKVITPSLRVGFVAAPATAVARVAAAIWATASMAPQPMVELVAGWLESGAIDRFLGWRRQEACRRFELFDRVFRGHRYQASPMAYHAWLELPEPWRPEEFVACARRRGVAVAPADVFAADPAAPAAVRISLLPVADLDRLEADLRTLTDILERPGEPGHCVV